MSDNIKVSDFRVYGEALNYYEIFSHAVRNMEIRNLKWDVPTGQRNYIETIERTFKFKSRDRKSNAFNLRILNADVVDPGMKAEIDKAIRHYIKHVSPIQTNVNRIEWRNDTPGTDDSTVISATGTNINRTGY